MAKSSGQAPERRLSMLERWKLDDENPSGVWFNNLDELKKALLGFNEHGIPIFDKNAGIHESDGDGDGEDEDEDENKQGKKESKKTSSAGSGAANDKSAQFGSQWQADVVRKWEIDPEKLPGLSQPWHLVQGYWDPNPSSGKVSSVTVVPSRQKAFEQQTSGSYGAFGRNRLKNSREVSYPDGVRQLQLAPRVAFKERYLIHDGGRAWIIDYFPLADHWQGETHFSNSADDVVLPSWVTKELTNTPEGFSAYHARPVAKDALSRLVLQASQDGSTRTYGPGETEGFQWIVKENRS